MPSYAMIALALACICLSVLFVDAGDYRGRPRPVRSTEEQYFNHVPTELLSKRHLPRHFNWCDVDGEDACVGSWNQHIPIYCGSCWVHGSLSMIQDRLKIKKGGRGPDTMLSRQTLLNCASYEGMGAGCDGGDVIDVFHYMAKFGLPDESCMTYAATDHKMFNHSLKHCPANAVCRNCMPRGHPAEDTCWAVPTPILYKLKSYGKVNVTGHQERAMMSEIYRRGPITCGIATPWDFTYGYRGGVYRDPKNYTRDSVDHDVEVVGWGEEEGEPIWYVRNSWGTYWGELSFFKLRRGINSLFIEDGDCWYAEPEDQMEEEVLDGELLGSMFGLVGEEDAAHMAAPRPSRFSRLVAAGLDRFSGVLQRLQSAFSDGTGPAEEGAAQLGKGCGGDGGEGEIEEVDGDNDDKIKLAIEDADEDADADADSLQASGKAAGQGKLRGAVIRLNKPAKLTRHAFVLPNV